MTTALHFLSLPRRISVPVIAAGAFFAGWCMPRGGDEVFTAAGRAGGKAGTVSGVNRTRSAATNTRNSLKAAQESWVRALTLQEGVWRDLETARAWRCLAESDPALAWSESFRLTEGAELRETLAPDAAAATAWISLTPGEHRANASIEMAGLLMKQSPEEALQWAGTAGDPDLRRDMELGVLTRWAQADPAAAAAWCAADDERAACLPAVISAWTASDPGAASEWLAARPADTARDSTTLSLIEPLLELEPASALAWARTLADPEIRRTAEERIAALTGPPGGTE